MKKVILLSAMIGLCFSATSLAADANHAQTIVASQERTHSASFFASKPRPIKWLTGEQQASVLGSRPRPVKWLTGDQEVSVVGAKPRPVKW